MSKPPSLSTKISLPKIGFPKMQNIGFPKMQKKQDIDLPNITKKQDMKDIFKNGAKTFSDGASSFKNSIKSKLPSKENMINALFAIIPFLQFLLILTVILCSILASKEVNAIINPFFSTLIIIITLISLGTTLIPKPYNYYNILILFGAVVLYNIIRIFYVEDPKIEIPFYNILQTGFSDFSDAIFDKKTKSQLNSANSKVESSSKSNPV